MVFFSNGLIVNRSQGSPWHPSHLDKWGHLDDPDLKKNNFVWRHLHYLMSMTNLVIRTVWDHQHHKKDSLSLKFIIKVMTSPLFNLHIFESLIPQFRRTKNMIETKILNIWISFFKNNYYYILYCHIEIYFFIKYFFYMSCTMTKKSYSFKMTLPVDVSYC